MEFKKIISANFGDDTLDIISLDKNEERETISLVNLFDKSKLKFSQDLADKLCPIDLCIDEYGKLLLVNSYDDSIFKIDLDKKELEQIVKVGKYPINIKVYKEKIYILNSDSNGISIVDNTNFKLIGNINIGGNPIDMKIDRLNKKIYTSNTSDCSISIISLKDKCNDTIGLNSQPRNIILEKQSIFILTNFIEADSCYSEIEEFQVSDNKFIRSYTIKGIFYNFTKLEGEEIFYLINSKDGYLYKFNSINNIIDKYIYIGGLSSKIKYRDKKTLYINNLIKNEIIAIDIIERKIKSRIKVGKEPHGFIFI